MNKLPWILMAAGCLIAGSSLAQDTNALKTDLGVFETRAGTVLIKGFSQAGSLTVGTVTIAVRCKLTTDTATGQKADGLAIEITGNSSTRQRILVDYAELDSLLSGINYLGKITYDVTPLPGFEASYSTKAGLRVVANSLRRQGGIQTAIEYGDDPKIPLSSDQLAQLYQLLVQARNNLDSVRDVK